MVKKIGNFFFLFLFFAFSLEAAKASLELSEKTFQEGQKIQGKIIVYHSEKENEITFQMEGKPLSVEKSASEEENGEMKTVFQFSIPSRTKGLYLLSPITVFVGKEKLTIPGKSYEIVPKRIPLQALDTLFYAESEFKGDPILYPGEKGTFIYRIFYNRSVMLTEENLPLLEPSGMVKLGNIQIRNEALGDVSVQEIRLEVEAKNPGNYHYAPSFLKGYIKGTKDFVEAKTPSLQIEIRPFPEEGKTPSFVGAVGEFDWDVRKETEGPVFVGDPIDVTITVTGKNSEDVEMPNFLCEPGFSGLFSMDLPKVQEVNENKKVFNVSFRPLAPFLTSLPPLIFSSFSKEKETYLEEIKPSISIEVVKQEKEKPVLKKEIYAKKQEIASVKPIEKEENIEFIPISPRSYFSLSYPGLGLFVFLFPFSLLFLLVEKKVKEVKERKEKEKRERQSDYFLKKAKEHFDEREIFFSYIEKALRHLLVEKNLSPYFSSSPKEWKKDPFADWVERWFKKMEKARYGKKDLSLSQKQFWEELKKWERLP